MHISDKMRSKQRPIKSHRHKSVASMIRPEISFKREERQGVMRLAFLENNDITPETWKDFDFNTLSSLILNRNIQNDLQEQEQPTSCASGSDSLIYDPLDIHPEPTYSPQLSYSPEPVHSPPPAYVRKPPMSATRPATRVSRSTGATQHASVTKSANIPAARPAHNQKPAHATRSSSIIKQQANKLAESKTFIDHSGQFLCDEPDCGKTFPSLRKLRHHKVVHSNDFPFICQFAGCGKRFKRKFGIDLHSTTHFDLDPEMYEKTSNNSSLTFFGRRMQYSMCKPCNQKFKTVHEYQDHMLEHGKEPFKCLVEGCGQTFSIWKSFQKHRASHYFNYYCKMDDQCGHSTSNLQLLKLHIYCCHFRRTLPENATLSRDHDDSYEEPDEAFA